MFSYANFKPKRMLTKIKWIIEYVKIINYTKYIENQINKIWDSVKDKQSRIARLTVNEISRRKNTTRAKLKVASQEERIHLWKQHFENVLGKPRKVAHEPITKIIRNQQDIKLGQFTQEELDSVLRKILNRQQDLMKYPWTYGRPGNSTTYCSSTAMPYITKTQSKTDKKRHPHFP